MDFIWVMDLRIDYIVFDCTASASDIMLMMMHIMEWTHFWCTL